MHELYLKSLRHLNLVQFPLPGGEALYFSPRSLAIIESDEAPGEILKAARKCKTLDELESLVPHISKENLLETLDSLVEIQRKGLLPREGGPAPRIFKEEPPIVRFVIANTSACNMACTYCYNRFAGTVSSFDEEKSLTSEDLKRALGLLGDLSGKARELELLFIGGEPLLRFDLIRGAVGFCRTVPALAEKKVRIFIITNGTLITRDILDFCSAHNIHVKLSIDGPRQVHDRSRIFPGGSGTYGAVVDRLPPYFSLYAHPCKAVTATVDSFSSDLSSIVEHFLSLGFRQIELTEHYGTGPVALESCRVLCAEGSGRRRSRVTRKGRQTLQRNMRAVAEIIELRLRSRQYVNIVPFHDALIFLHNRRPNRFPCRVGLDSVALFSDGRFYPCHHFMGDGTFALGDLETGPDLEKMRTLQRHVAQRRKCRRCWCRFLCGGECYHRALVEGSDSHGHYERGCLRRKAVFREAVLLYHRLRTRDPESLDWYSRVNLYP